MCHEIQNQENSTEMFSYRYRLTEHSFLIVFQYFLVDNNKQTASVLDTIKLPTCTHIDLRQNVTLRGGIKSGNFTKLGEVADMQTCIDACCQDLKCDVAFMAETTCYSLKCFSEKVCETVPSKPRRTNKSVQISHIVRGGGRGDDLETFSQQQGIEKYGKSMMHFVSCFVFHSIFEPLSF